MRPYGESGGCSEEPAEFHRCATAKAKPNLRDRTWFDHVGNFYSDMVHIVERWTMFDPDVMHYEATIDDPSVYTRPWTMALGWRRNSEPGYEVWENACWEGVSQGPRFGEGRNPGAVPK